MVLDTSLLNTQQYKVCIKGKVEQSWERSSQWAFAVPSWQHVAEHCHPGNVWLSIVMEQNYNQAWTHVK